MPQSTRPGLRELTASTAVPGWLLVPEGLTEESGDRWVEQALGDLVSAWDEPVDDEAGKAVAAMLHASLVDRGDAPFVFDVWPIRAPFRSRVRVHALVSGEATDWEALGYDVTTYDTSALGPGLRCVGVGEAAVEGGTIETVEWWATFDDGDMTIAVHVESTPTLLFDRMLAGLYGLTDSLEAVRADGAPFRALPPQPLVSDPEAVWDPDAPAAGPGPGEGGEGSE